PPRPATYAETGRVLRFDTKALYAAVSEERERRGLTWDQVAAEIWPALSEHSVTRVEGPSGRWGPNQLRGLAKGGRADVHCALAICGWLGRTIQSFSRETIV